jgi:hypothetical protein
MRRYVNEGSTGSAGLRRCVGGIGECEGVIGALEMQQSRLLTQQ